MHNERIDKAVKEYAGLPISDLGGSPAARCPPR